MNLKVAADRIAAKYHPDEPGWSTEQWERLRDHCDLQTGGELSAFALDILTDMVKARVRKGETA